jgi:tetratricopeptide (TPR) repeat protein
MKSIGEDGTADFAAATARCRELAEKPGVPWVTEVIDTWPTPIAHEYWRLREELRRGEIAAILWQFKDVAEILIRFPALVMAREVLECAEPSEGAHIRRMLLGGPLTLGAWHSRLREMAAMVVAAGVSLFPLSAALAREMVGGTGRRAEETAWTRFLRELVEWRNTDFGHGSFRLDPTEYIENIERSVLGLNRHLADQVRRGLWREAMLREIDPLSPALCGWQPVRATRDVRLYGHSVEEKPLYLFSGDQRRLRLSPFVSLRRCRICRRIDIFCFDGREGRSERDPFGFVDFALGHPLVLPNYRVPELAAEAGEPWSAGSLEGDLDDPFSDREVEARLETATLRARYLRPTHLREVLADFIRTRSRGVFWLRAPGHTGKSIFVHSLAAPSEVGERPLLPDLVVAAFHIRREFRASPLQFQDFLEIDLVRDRLRIGARLRRLRFELEDPHPARAFCAFLDQAMRARSGSGRVLICLDGLDELPDGSPILEYLPNSELLPDDVFLCLTSRPIVECPPQTARRLAAWLAADPEAETAEVGLAADADDVITCGYRTVVRHFFDREVEALVLAELRAALARFVERSATSGALHCRDDLARSVPPALHDRIVKDWRELTLGLRIHSPPGAAGLKTVVEPVFARFDAAFAAIWTAANGRFQYVSHLTLQYRDRALSVADIAELPHAEQLYTHYFRQLEIHSGGSKLWELALRTILALAAQAGAAEWIARETGSAVWEREESLDLAGLASRLGILGRPARLALLLYELKDILLVMRGNREPGSRYRLANADILSIVRRSWPELLRAAHQNTVEMLLEDCPGGGTETFRDEELCCIAAHASLGEVRHHPLLATGGAFYNEISRRADRARRDGRLDTAIALVTAALNLAEWRAVREPALSAYWAIPLQLRHRALALIDTGRLAPARRDADQAVLLFRELRNMADAGQRKLLEFEIAATLVARADILTGLGDSAAARDKYTRAVEIIDQTPFGEMPARVAHEISTTLVTALINRARAHGMCGMDALAKADLDRAVASLEQGGRTLSADGERRKLLATALITRSVLHVRRGDPASGGKDAETAFQLSAGNQGLGQELADVPPDAVELAASALYQLGGVRLGMRDYHAALSAHDAALQLRLSLRQRLGADYLAPMRASLAESYRGRAMSLLFLRKPDEALRDADEAIAIEMDPDADAPQKAARQAALGHSYQLRADIQTALGDIRAAQADRERAVALGR